jgi:PadR family transcriptional regulator, regulatory protein PadR
MKRSENRLNQVPVGSIGQFEQVVLTAVTTLGERRAYGLAVFEQVKNISVRPVTSLGSIYTTLDRLEKKGMVSSWYADESTDRGGRPRKYFRIEAAGQAALSDSRRQAEAIAVALATAEGIA